MKEKNAKITFYKAGNGTTNKVTIPAEFARFLELSKENNDIKIKFEVFISRAIKSALRLYEMGKMIDGGVKRDRTADLLNAIQALSQLSYNPKRFCNFTLFYLQNF